MLQDLPVWLAHFRSQAAHPRQVPTTLDDTLTGRERRLIAHPSPRFSWVKVPTGAHLRARGAPSLRIAGRNTPSWKSSICSSPRRSGTQACSATSCRITRFPGVSALCTDQAFRALRHLGGLEARLRILVTAEIIGIVYYRALEGVTDCRRLQILCRTMAADELAHVAFESQLLLADAGRPARHRETARRRLGAVRAHGRPRWRSWRRTGGY